MLRFVLLNSLNQPGLDAVQFRSFSLGLALFLVVDFRTIRFSVYSGCVKPRQKFGTVSQLFETLATVTNFPISVSLAGRIDQLWPTSPHPSLENRPHPKNLPAWVVFFSSRRGWVSKIKLIPVRNFAQFCKQVRVCFSGVRMKVKIFFPNDHQVWVSEANWAQIPTFRSTSWFLWCSRGGRPNPKLLLTQCFSESRTTRGIFCASVLVRSFCWCFCVQVCWWRPGTADKWAAFCLTGGGEGVLSCSLFGIKRETWMWSVKR